MISTGYWRTALLCLAPAFLAMSLISGCPRRNAAPPQTTGTPTEHAADDTAPAPAPAPTLPPGQWWGEGCDPHRQGATANTGPRSCEVLWSINAGGTFSGHIGLLPDGTVIAGFTSAVAAFNPDGTKRWNIAADGFRDFSIAAVPDVRVYLSQATTVAEPVQLRGNIDSQFHKRAGHLTAIDPDRGELWHVDTDGELLGMPLVLESGEVTGMLLVSKGEFRNGYFYGYNDYPQLLNVSPDGRRNWQKLLPRLDPGSAPTPAAHPVLLRDGNFAFCWSDQMLHTLKPDSFRNWDFQFKSVPDCPPAMAPNGRIIQLANDRPTLTDKQLKYMDWEAMNSYGVLHSVRPGGSRGWDMQVGSDVHSAPAISAKSTVHFGATTYTDSREGQSRFGHVYALSSDGQLIYNYTTRAEFADCPQQPAPLVDAAGTLYISDAGGNLYAIANDGSLLWEYAAPKPFATNPVITPGGVLHIGGTDDKLYAFGPGTQSATD